MIRIRAADKLSIGILLTVIIGLWIPRLHGPIDLRYDAGVYYLTGAALASGKGYRILSEPGEILAVQYPPLLPGIVAITKLAVGTESPVVVGRALRIMNFILSAVLGLATFTLARRFLGSGWALFGAPIPTLHTHTVFMSDLLFAELPYSLTSLLFFILASRLSVERSAAASTGRRIWATGLLGAAGFLLRTSGIALLSAWIADLVLRRQWRQALVALFVTVLCVGGWHTYVYEVTNDPSYGRAEYSYQRAAYQFYNVSYADDLKYVDPFQPELGLIGMHELLSRVQTNVSQLPARIGETVTANRDWGATIAPATGRKGILVFTLQLLWIGPVGIFLFSMLPLAGLFVLLVRRQLLLPLYVGSSIMLISITPWPGQFLRYLSPLAPILGIATAVALAEVTAALRSMLKHSMPKHRGPALAPMPAVLIAGLILSIQLYALVKMFRFDHSSAEWNERSGQTTSYRLFFYGRAWKSLDAAIDWLSSNARQDAIVVTNTPHWVFMKTGLRAVMPPFESDPATAQRLIDSVPAQFLVIDKLSFTDVSRRYGTPVLEQFPNYWRLIYAADNEDVQIYERVRTNSNVSGEPAQ